MNNKTVVLAAMAVILLIGCHNNPVLPVEPEIVIPAAVIKSEEEPLPAMTKQSVTYLFSESDFRYYNLISYESKEAAVNRDGTVNVRYYEIDGLPDQEIQQNINDRVMNAAIDLYNREIPPYRGIRRAVSETDAYDIYVDCTVSRMGNLYSILLTRSLHPKGKDIYITEAMPLNFNLETGEDVRFSDLFYEGYDYESVISNYITRCSVDGILPHERIEVLEMAGWYRTDITLLKPVETISPDQKFVIMENCINLILDYDIPEVENRVAYSSYTAIGHTLLPIDQWQLEDAGAGIAVEEMYGSLSAWYGGGRGDSNRRVLARDTDIRRKYWHSDNSLIKAHKKYGADFKISVVRNIDNQELQQMVEQRAGCAEDMLIEFLDSKPEHLEEYHKWVLYEYQADRYGQFLWEHTAITAPDYSGFGYYADNIYDIETGQQIKLEDCFAPGVDYKALLTPLISEDYDSSDPEIWEDANLFMSEDGYFKVSFSNSWHGYYYSLTLDPATIGFANLAKFK